MSSANLLTMQAGTLPEDTIHWEDEHGPGNAGVAMMATSRLHEAGIGLGDDGWRVLRYTELEALEPWEAVSLFSDGSFDSGTALWISPELDRFERLT